jgi:hypothetical protein
VTRDCGIDVVRKRLKQAWVAHCRPDGVGADPRAHCDVDAACVCEGVLTRRNHFGIDGDVSVTSVCKVNLGAKLAQHVDLLHGLFAVFVLNGLLISRCMEPLAILAQKFDCPHAFAITANGFVVAFAVRDIFAQVTNNGPLSIHRALVVRLLGLQDTLFGGRLGDGALEWFVRVGFDDLICPVNTVVPNS